MDCEMETPSCIDENMAQRTEINTNTHLWYLLVPKGTFPLARNGCGADSGLVSTNADPPRERRGSAVAQQKIEFYP